MRAVEISKFGLENLATVDRADPTPGPGSVALRVRAVSLNYRDVMMARGVYNPRQKLPLVPCSDAVCDVIAVGPGVARVKVGDRVASAFTQDYVAPPIPRDGRHLKSTLGGPLDGVLAETIVLSDNGLVPVPG